MFRVWFDIKFLKTQERKKALDEFLTDILKESLGCRAFNSHKIESLVNVFL